MAVSNKGQGNSVIWAKLHNQYGNQEYNSLILTTSSLLYSLRNTLSLNFILRKPDLTVCWLVLLHFTFCCISLLLLYSLITLMHCVPQEIHRERCTLVSDGIWHCSLPNFRLLQKTYISANVNKEFYGYHFGFRLVQCYHLCWLWECAFLWLWVIFSRWM